jgi:hypothetical protein
MKQSKFLAVAHILSVDDQSEPETNEDQAPLVNPVSSFCLYFKVTIKGLVKTHGSQTGTFI